MASKDNYIVGIGAANVDVYAKSKIKIKTHYDHPSIIETTAGGVTRNILENYVLLGGNAKLITAVGDDVFGKVIIDTCKKRKIDTKHILIKKDTTSSVFMQIQDNKNDMYLAACDMSILDCLTSDYLNKKKRIIQNSKLVLFDPSLQTDTIKTLFDICKDKVEIYCDPISDNYALKIKPYIGNIDVIKPNKTELECLAGIKIKKDEDIYKAANILISKGVKKVFVSLAEDGILYVDSKGISIHRKLKPVKKMVNASGAGDAAMAAIILGGVNKCKIEKTIDYALAAGIAAITSKTTINENLSIRLLNKILKENE